MAETREWDVTAPDGKTFVVTTPANATQEQALEFAQKSFSGGQSQPAAQGSAPDPAAQTGEERHRYPSAGQAISNLYRSAVPKNIRESISGGIESFAGSKFAQTAKQAYEENPILPVGVKVLQGLGMLINEPIDYLLSRPLGAVHEKSLEFLGAPPEFAARAGENLRGISNLAIPFLIPGGGARSKFIGPPAPSTGLSLTDRIKGLVTPGQKAATITDLEEKIAAYKMTEPLKRERSTEEIVAAIRERNKTESFTTAVQDIENKIAAARLTDPMAKIKSKQELAAAIESQKPAQAQALAIVEKAGDRSLTPEAAGLALKGPRIQVDLKKPEGIFWQRQAKDRAPYKQGYDAMLKAGKVQPAQPTSTLGTIDAILEEAGLGGRAFPSGGERAGAALKGAVERSAEKQSGISEISIPRRQSLENLKPLWDVTDIEDQGYKIGKALAANVREQPGKALSISRDAYRQLLAGVMDNPEVTFHDLHSAQMKIRAAGRAVKDERVVNQLGQLDKALEADMVAANGQLAGKKTLLDFGYKRDIVPYYVKGAAVREIVEGKNPGDILKAVVGLPSGRDATVINQFEKMIGDTPTFRRIFTRPWVEDKVRLATDKTKTGTFQANDLLETFISLSPEKKTALFGDLTPLFDDFIASAQRANRVIPEIRTAAEVTKATAEIAKAERLSGLQRYLGAATGNLARAKQLEDAISTQLKDVANLKKESAFAAEAGTTTPLMDLKQKLAAANKLPIVGGKLGQHMAVAGIVMGAWRIASGVATADLSKIAQGGGVIISAPMLAKLMTSERGLRVLKAGAEWGSVVSSSSIVQRGKQLTVLMSQVNAVLDPLHSKEASMEDKIKAAMERIPTTIPGFTSQFMEGTP